MKDKILTICSTYSAGHNQNQFKGVNQPNLMFNLIQDISKELNNAIIITPAILLQYHNLRVGLNNFLENTKAINDLNRKNPNKDFLA